MEPAVQQTSKKNLEHAPTPSGKYTDKIEKFGWKLQDSPGEFAWINKHVLLVDHEYQRHLNVRRCIDLASAWSWLACGTLIVAERDGKFFVVEGQHRLGGAMRRSDIKEVPCLVFKSIGLKHEAETFLSCNVRRSPPKVLERFNAMLMAQEPHAMLVAKLVASIDRQIGDPSPNHVGCVGRLLVCAKDDPEALENIFPLLGVVAINRTVPDFLVGGMWHIEHALRKDGKESLTDSRWSRRFIKVGFDSLIDSIHKTRIFRNSSGPRVWAEGIMNALNRGMSNKFSVSDADPS